MMRNSLGGGVNRRDFMRVGGMGAGGLSLAGLMQARALAGGGRSADTSVVWLWLGGGPTHIETFDPKMEAPSEYRSVTGEVRTKLTGVTLGGTFPKMAQVADKMAFVRSFTHNNSGHGGGTHWLMTGYDNRVVDNGGKPTRPSIGSILARTRGSNHPETGMPRYVRLGGISYDGPTFLGTSYTPFDPSGQARKNLDLGVSTQRFEDRRALLGAIDRLDGKIDADGLLDGVDGFTKQAINVLTGNTAKAFEVSHEDPKVVERYGPGLGQQLLTARRLCEAGCGFVTLSYSGWDMHGNIKKGMESRAPQLDHAVAAFVEDLARLGLDQKILLVITGEFGRTPKINANGGRDHWSRLSTLALAGGGLRMGQVVGESAPKVDEPRSRPVSPQDLMATIFHVLGIDPHLQFTDNAGRPVYMLDGGKPIPELV